MHYVDCGSQPEVLNEITRKMSRNSQGYLDWRGYWKNKDKDKERSKEYRKLVVHLAKKYGNICAYCERDVGRRFKSGQHPDSLEHFRPIDLFPGKCATWENLNYACSFCDKSKGGDFPGKVCFNKMKKLAMPTSCDKEFDERFIDPTKELGYVDPRDAVSKAESFFIYNKRGEILPNPDLDNLQWSKAARTICDFRLNGTSISYRENTRRQRKEAYNDLKQAKKMKRKTSDPANFAFPSFCKWMNMNLDDSTSANS